jgi:hypothetical protein
VRTSLAIIICGRISNKPAGVKRLVVITLTKGKPKKKKALIMVGK